MDIMRCSNRILRVVQWRGDLVTMLLTESMKLLRISSLRKFWLSSIRSIVRFTFLCFS